MSAPASNEPAGEAIVARRGAPILRPYQLKAGAAVESSFFKDKKNRLLVKKPTGTGKTVWFAALLGPAFPRLAEWLASFKTLKGAKVLVIAHREELLDQAAEKISRGTRGVMVSVEQGDRRSNRYSDVVVAGIQTLAAQRFKRLKTLLRYHSPRLIVIDEAHHAAAASYRTALVHLGFLPPTDASDEEDIEGAREADVATLTHNLEPWDAVAPKDRLLIGVTATPNRSDAIGLNCVFQTIAYNYDLKQAIADGYLTPIVAWVVETSSNLDDVHLARGDFNQRELAEAVNVAQRNALAVQAWLDYAFDRQTICFAVNVQHALELAEEFKRAGIKAEAISGETSRERRRALLQAYRRREIRMLVNAMLLTEGTDLPETSCIIHAAPTRSSTLYEQKTGRGLRIHPDDPAGPDRLAAIARGETLLKPECILIDLVDVAKRHSLMTSPCLYGLPPTILTKGERLDDVAAKVERMVERAPGFKPEELGRISVAALELKASTFDVFTESGMGPAGAGLRYQWVRTRPDEFQLRYPWQDGIEVLTVRRSVVGLFELTGTIRPADGSPSRSRVLLPGAPSARAALQVAELFVLNDRRSVNGVIDRTASHRKRDATDRQLGKLRALGFKVPTDKKLTLAEASTLIDVYEERARRRS